MLDVKDCVKKNGHLPNMFTVKQVQENGYSLYEMNVKLLEKIEGLIFYAIDQDKEISNLKIQLKELRSLDVRIKKQLI
ncbi:hypothetical protein M2T82_00020 [Elizabethkingia ursingii]|uniref:hypothetical protein n=1 Tax=Elizabethkingia ursingii TaxID=1756150 RepID=UPI002012132D|nr:hypothetical protein [Elizabethkingia ursingii]MCL1666438.1 hypothetical protein [Elizabethkingia ursingii]